VISRCKCPALEKKYDKREKIGEGTKERGIEGKT